MIDMIQIGEYFISSLSAIGDFLLWEPLSFLSSWLDQLFNSIGFILPDFIEDMYRNFVSSSIAELIFGEFLIYILGFKLVKFILDTVL